MPADETLMKAADAARAIAERLHAKSYGYPAAAVNRKHFTAMSAGARLVAVKLIEMADEAGRDAAGLPEESADG